MIRKRKDESPMRILVVNDDGIDAKGIHILANAAKQLGEVWVVAPDTQCSAMSQRITICGELTVKERQIPVEGVHAYSVSGTPADCVKVALYSLLPEKPDIVFSGINIGYNVGQDVLYSGTVGAAVEALSNGIPAIAFSSGANGNYDVVQKYLLPIIEDLVRRKLPMNALWNVNIPDCSVDECKGILENRISANHQFYGDYYEKKEELADGFVLTAGGILTTTAEEGTDIRAVLDRYISIGTITNGILAAADKE